MGDLNLKLILAAIATLLAVGGNIPYLLDMFHGRVKPHPYSWLVWSIVSCIVVFGLIARGGGIGTVPVAVSETFTILIFLFSLKFGFSGITRLDTLFLVFGMIAIAAWFFVGPTTSVVLAVIIDLLAFVPTLRKTWKFPASEAPALYGSNALRHILVLGSLRNYNLATMLHSVAMIIVNTLMTAIILRNRRREDLKSG